MKTGPPGKGSVSSARRLQVRDTADGQSAPRFPPLVSVEPEALPRRLMAPERGKIRPVRICGLMIKDDEGHGVREEDNRIELDPRADAFRKRHLH